MNELDTRQKKSLRSFQPVVGQGKLFNTMISLKGYKSNLFRTLTLSGYEDHNPKKDVMSSKPMRRIHRRFLWDFFEMFLQSSMRHNLFSLRFIFFCITCTLIVQGQTLDQYTFSAVNGTFTQISGSGGETNPGLSGDDNYYNSIPIGFTFSYLGVAYTYVCASTNGFLSLATSSTDNLTSSYNGNNLISGGKRPLLAPLWDDLNTPSFCYKLSGTAGSRVFTAEWLNVLWPYNGSTNVISFQVKLYEGTNQIDFVYRQDANPPSVSVSASIGITGIGTGSGNFISLNGSGSSPSVSMTTETSTISTRPATGQIYSFSTAPPAIPSAPILVSPVNGATNKSITPMLQWTSNGYSTSYRLQIATDINFVNGIVLDDSTVTGTSKTVIGLAYNTTYYWRVNAKNISGSSAFSSVWNFTTLKSPPTITSFTPTSGTIGTTVTINGSYFNTTVASNIVYFGVVRGTVTAATSTSLSVRVPLGASYAPISVTDTAMGVTAYSTAPFVVTFLSSHAIDTASYAGKVDFATGSYPQSVAISDLDGDGKPDLAVTNSNSNTVSVYRNTSISGSMSFTAKVDYTTGSVPQSVAIGDVDGDGKPDLVVVNGDNTVSVYRNQSTSGNISFAAKVDYTTGSSPYSLAIGDVDGDGRPDIVVTNSYSNTISIFQNTSTSGNISFLAKVDYTTGSSPFGVTIGDLDGDGKPDLAVANYSSSTVSVFRNMSTSGNISFATKVDYTTGSYPRGVAIGDFDGDGKPDLAVANYYSSTVSVFRNQSTSGSISFAAKVDYTTGSYPYSVAIGDVDGDGKPDLAVANSNSSDNTVSILQNKSTSGNISFAAKVDYKTGNYPYSVAIGDLDGDGKPDLAVANYYSNTVSVIRNTIPVIQPP
ncbi:MAG: FG-GAP-like repeat-containing protein, partial [Bacteroidota bacterium]